MKRQPWLFYVLLAGLGYWWWQRQQPPKAAPSALETSLREEGLID